MFAFLVTQCRGRGYSMVFGSYLQNSVAPIFFKQLWSKYADLKEKNEFQAFLAVCTLELSLNSPKRHISVNILLHDVVLQYLGVQTAKNVWISIFSFEMAYLEYNLSKKIGTTHICTYSRLSPTPIFSSIGHCYGNH